jgi:SAM-dependent methyltransferase
MGVTDALRTARWRAAGHFSRPLDAAFTAPLRGAAVLEVGGPTRAFDAGGLVPVYPVAAGVDNVQFAARTAWHDLGPAEDFAPGGVRRGRQWIVEGGDLDGIPDGAFDAVVCSHVIEHLADPLGGLAAWRRVTRPGGHLLLVAPHRDGTFDRRRPVTTLGHLVDDHARAVGEDDLTHLDETLALHDFALDVPQDRATWEAARRDNARTRLLHHHVFSTPSLLALLDHAGLELLDAETRFPHDIYVLARFADTPPDNAEFLARRRPSPFPTDRRR